MEIIGRLTGIGLDGDGDPEAYVDVFVRYALPEGGGFDTAYVWAQVPFTWAMSDAQVRAAGLQAIKDTVLAITGAAVPSNAKIRVFGI